MATSSEAGEIREIKSVVSGQAKELPSALHLDDFVGTLREQLAKALRIGMKQVMLMKGKDVLSDDDDSVTLKEALDGEAPTYSIRGPDVYKENLQVPAQPKQAFSVIKTVEFPAPSGININMMPIIIEDAQSIPEKYRHYYPLIEACFRIRMAPSKVGYLTINEGNIDAGASQRRGGLHIECPGYLHGNIDSHGKYQRVHDCFGNDRGDKFEGGIFMASTVSKSTAFWELKVEEPGEMVGSLGDLEHVRQLLPEEKKRVLEAGELVWFTDTTPHEALPLQSAGTRQFFRLVVGKLSQWNEEHNTPNPLGVTPDPKVTKVVKYNKFDPAARCKKLEKATAPCTYITVILDGLEGEEPGFGCVDRRVAYITLGENKLSDWNKKHPEEAIKVWDTIVGEDNLTPHSGTETNPVRPKSLTGYAQLTFMRGHPLKVAPGQSPEALLPWAGLQAWFDAGDAVVDTDKKGWLREKDETKQYLKAWPCKAKTGNVFHRSWDKRGVTLGNGLVNIGCKDMGRIHLTASIAKNKTKFWIGYLDEANKAAYLPRTGRFRFRGSDDWLVWNQANYGDDCPVWPKGEARIYCWQADEEGEGAVVGTFESAFVHPEGYGGRCSKWTDVHIAEMLFYDRILNDSEIDSVFKYLSEKWKDLLSK